VADGLFPGDPKGDRRASIALARDPSGREHAWVVWSGHDFSPEHLLPVELRRLSQLRNPRGVLVQARH
jgi:hypothetical protein